MDAFAYIAENPGYVATKFVEHFYLFIVSWIIAVIVGLAIAVAATRPGKERAGRILLSVTGAAQSVPSIAVIAIVFIFLGIGATPAIFALCVYSLVPITFNGASGFLSVDPSIKAAARGMGMRNSQILTKIEMPIAVAAIASGARSAATINIGAAAIASAIGAGGLGEIIFIGLRSMEVGIIIAGALPTAALAVAVDAILAVAERRITSPGLSMGAG